jgi:hypothetical protein
VTLLSAALAAVCTIAPSAQHRILFRHEDKQHLVFSANRVVIAGLAFLAVAMCGSLLLVATKLFGTAVGVITATIGAIPFALLWFAMPLRRRVALDAADWPDLASNAPDSGAHAELGAIPVAQARTDPVVRPHAKAVR